MNSLSNQSFRGVLWNCLTEKSRNIPKKISVVEPCLIKLQGNVSRTEPRRRLSLWGFPILEQSFCGAHASFSFCSLDASRVSNREVLLCSLSELATDRSTKEQLLRNFPEKWFIGNSFLETLHDCSLQHTLSKLFTTLALSSR